MVACGKREREREREAERETGSTTVATLKLGQPVRRRYKGKKVNIITDARFDSQGNGWRCSVVVMGRLRFTQCLLCSQVDHSKQIRVRNISRDHVSGCVVWRYDFRLQIGRSGFKTRVLLFCYFFLFAFFSAVCRPLLPHPRTLSQK